MQDHLFLTAIIVAILAIPAALGACVTSMPTTFGHERWIVNTFRVLSILIPVVSVGIAVGAWLA